MAESRTTRGGSRVEFISNEEMAQQSQKEATVATQKTELSLLTARIAELNANGYELKLQEEYSMRETQQLLGQSPMWVRRQVTGYMGPNKPRKVLIKGRITDLGWRIPASEVEVKLAEIAAKKAMEEARRADPATFPNYRNSAARAVNALKREAGDKLTEDDQKTLAALLKKLQA